MKADYHFHPNLHAKMPEKRLKRIWEALKSQDIDAIVCSEHVYKNAPDAYRQLLGAKPHDAKTHVFPGAELITKEGKGIEIIAFAEHDWYDDHPKLLEPLTMSFKEMVDYLEASDLQWFIPHPFLLGNPLKKLYPGHEGLMEFLRTVPAYEIQNGCYLLLEEFYRMLPIRWFSHTQAAKFRDSVLLPPHRVPDGKHRFIAVGSDAHHPRDIGFCVDIPTEKPVTDRSEAFRFLTNNTAVENIHIPFQAFSLRHLMYTGWTTFSESCMKREWRRNEYRNRVLSATANMRSYATTTHPSA